MRRVGVSLVSLLLVAGCRRDPPRPRPPADVPVTSVITAADARAGGCPARDLLREGGTTHADEVTADERWRAEDSPHRVPFGVRVRPGASLVVDPCAIVLVGASRGVEVQPGAALVARGEPLRPIVFAALEEAPWAGLDVQPGASAATALANVELSDAGARVDEERVPCALFVGAPGLLAQGLTLRGSRGWGLRVGPGAAFAPGSALVVTGAAEGVAYFDDADDVGAMPPGRYGGNARDEVLIAGHGSAVRRDASWGGLGLRYRVRDGVRLAVGGPRAPRLRVAPGTTVRFGQDSALDVALDAPGALELDGAPGAGEVLLAAASDAPASWFGVTLGARIDVSRSVIRNVRVVGAGAPSGALVGGCGCAEGVRGDAAAITVRDVDLARVVSNVLVQRASARGVGVARLGDVGAPQAPLVAPGRVDVSAAGVACAELGPTVRGRCVGERVVVQGASRDPGVRSGCDGGRCTGPSRGSREER